MRVVPILVGTNHVFVHVFFFDPRRGIHRDGRFVPQSNSTEHMSGHMLQMPRFGRDFAQLQAAIERVHAFPAIPVVDAVVQRTHVVGIFRKYLL